MSCLSFCLLICVSCVLISTTVSHLCIITPRQRGDMDISEGGSHTCFRHGAPCGGQAPEAPKISLQGGRPVFIKWQQNYNHYSVGYPGFMDIAIAPAKDVAKMSHVTGAPDPFHILAVVADTDEYDQDHQRNYTAVVTLPNMKCDHCVIRARYAAHKPGETTFYQCSDVVVTTSSTAVHPETMQTLSETTSPKKYPYLMPGPFMTSRISRHTNDTRNEKPVLMSILSNRNQHTNDEMDHFVAEDTKSENDNLNQRTNTVVMDTSVMGEDHIKKAVDFTISNHLATINKDRTTLNSQVDIEQSTQIMNEHTSVELLGKPATETPMNKEQEKASIGPRSRPTPRNFLAQNDLQTSTTSSANIYGLSNNIDFPGNANLVSFDTVTGIRYELAPLPFRVDSPLFRGNGVKTSRPLNSSVDFVTDGVLTLDTARHAALMPMNRHDNRDAIANTIIEMDTRGGAVQAMYNVSNADRKPLALKSAFSAVIVEIEGTYVTFNVEPDTSGDGKFNFIVGRLFVGGSWVMLSKTDKGEDTFINFQWAEYDVSVKTLYVLLGNENDADGMSARLYKFFVLPGPPPTQPSPDSSSYVTLDVSKYTFMAFHLHPYHTNLLYAVSPGLHNATSPSYHLVLVDVDMGTVKEEIQITPPGIFERFYGGAIINGLQTYPGQLLHVLRIAHTQADVIATIDLTKKTVSFSQVTNLRNVYSLYANI